MNLLKETVIKESSISEITIGEEIQDVFFIRRWDKKSGNCTDSIYLNKSDVKTILSLMK